MKFNKQGSTMVEAAMVFPLIILTVTALIYMLVFLYQQTEIRAQMHIALRADSGRASETLEYKSKVTTRFPIYRKKDQSYYQGELNFIGQGILKRMNKELSAYKYIDDEMTFIRSVDLLKQKE